MLTAEDIIKKLNLQPHPKEGGFFAETYRSSEKVSLSHLPGHYTSDHDFGTAIYYLLTPQTFSGLHVLKSDEIFHFYLGDPVEMINLYPDGKGKMITLGQNLLSMKVQHVVPRGVMQGARLKAGGQFALLGCTVAPGFDYSDYQNGKKGELLITYPDFADWINDLALE
ncbi:MAG: cupin domain-containing protein [Spirochaetes bacterium]|nr:cupin domain-containing protein [Spirochaetota bacterium]